MTDRERWIVYPLLFFALSLAAQGACGVKGVRNEETARRKWVNPPKYGKFDQVECQRLVVVSPSGAHRVEIGAGTNQAGVIQLLGPDGRKSVVRLGADNKGEVGLLETFDRNGKPLVALTATAQGGLVTTSKREGNQRLFLGFGGERIPSGLFGIDANSIFRMIAPMLPLTQQRQPPKPPKPDKPDEKETPAEKTSQ